LTYTEHLSTDETTSAAAVSTQTHINAEKEAARRWFGIAIMVVSASKMFGFMPEGQYVASSLVKFV